MTEIKNEQNVQISTPDLSSVNLSTNTSEVQTQSEINTQTNNISIEENKNNYNKKKKIATIGKRCIIIGLILFIIGFIFNGGLIIIGLILCIIGFMIKPIGGLSKSGDENKTQNKQENKIISLGNFLDILGLFFLMFSIFFIRVGGTGWLLLIGFSLLLTGFILGIIGARREAKFNFSNESKIQTSSKSGIKFPISIFVIIPVWFITMLLIDYIIEDASLGNIIIAQGWLGIFCLGIILSIIELRRTNKKIRVFIVIPIVLDILFISAIILFEDIGVKYQHSLCYSEGNHVENGKYVSYDYNGNIRLEGNCKDGWEDGKRIRYDYDGSIKEEQNYKNGELDGKRITYHDNGQIYDESNYKNGVRDGKQTYYFENGQVSYEGYIKNGKDIGKRVKYYENGNIERETEYDDFGIILKLVEYYENGNIKEERNYEPGDTVGPYLISYKNWKHTYYYKNGNIAVEGKYSDWKKVGKRTHYNEDGSIKSIEEY